MKNSTSKQPLRIKASRSRCQWLYRLCWRYTLNISRVEFYRSPVCLLKFEIDWRREGRFRDWMQERAWSTRSLPREIVVAAKKMRSEKLKSESIWRMALHQNLLKIRFGVNPGPKKRRWIWKPSPTLLSHKSNPSAEEAKITGPAVSYVRYTQ